MLAQTSLTNTTEYIALCGASLEIAGDQINANRFTVLLGDPARVIMIKSVLQYGLDRQELTMDELHKANTQCLEIINAAEAEFRATQTK